MSIERYHCVAKPLDPSSRMTRSRALCIVAFIWVYSSIFSFMPVFGINQYVPEGFLTSCSFNYLSDEFRDRAFIMSFFVAAWCVPIFIICWCYTGIMRSVSETQRLFLHHSQSLNDRTSQERTVENQRKIEIKLAKISFFLITVWTVSWTPYAIVALLGIFTDRSMLTPMMSMVPALFCKMSSISDPFIYGLSNRQFKRELLKRLVSLCKSRKIQNRNVASFLMRNMSVKSRDISMTDEHVEVSLSYQDHRETALDENICFHGETKMQPNQDSVDKESDKSESSPKKLPTEQTDNSNCNVSGDNELNNNIGLKRIRVFPIPHVYVIERYNDIIKIKSRRSF